MIKNKKKLVINGGEITRHIKSPFIIEYTNGVDKNKKKNKANINKDYMELDNAIIYNENNFYNENNSYNINTNESTNINETINVNMVEEEEEEEEDVTMIDEPRCVKHIRDNLQIKQGIYGMCWFTSFLNTIFLSDKISNMLGPLVNIEFLNKHCDNPGIIAAHLEMEVQNKPYINENNTNIKNDIIAYKSFKIANELFDENLFITHLTDTEDYIFPNRGINGGFSHDIIVPYLLKLGFPIINMKHIIIHFDNITKKKYDPRDVKITRLCQEFLKIHLLNNIEIKIFIVSFIEPQYQILHDIQTNRDFLYIGNYICFINEINEKIKLSVYTLDCGFLTTNNNGSRNMGHAICMITCNKIGYIVNSIKSVEPVVVSKKSCEVYEYDWINWKPREYYYHDVKAGCEKADIMIKNDNDVESTIDFNNKLHATNEECLYHKNIGNNSLIYILEKYEIDRNNMIESIHDNDPITKNYYDHFTKPYLYLLLVDKLVPIFTIKLYNIVNIDLESDLYNIIQIGILKSLIGCVYEIKITKNADIMVNYLKKYLPNDILILQDKSNNLLFYFITEYMRGVDNILFG